jgi:hypothetical protein
MTRRFHACLPASVLCSSVYDDPARADVYLPRAWDDLKILTSVCRQYSVPEAVVVTGEETGVRLDLDGLEVLLRIC